MLRLRFSLSCHLFCVYWFHLEMSDLITVIDNSLVTTETEIAKYLVLIMSFFQNCYILIFIIFYFEPGRITIRWCWLFSFAVYTWTFCDIVEKWGIQGKILSLVSDNVVNIKNAITVKLKWLYFGCFVHILNLITEDALKNEEISNIINKIKHIVTQFKRSSKSNEKLS